MWPFASEVYGMCEDCCGSVAKADRGTPKGGTLHAMQGQAAGNGA